MLTLVFKNTLKSTNETQRDLTIYHRVRLNSISQFEIKLSSDVSYKDQYYIYIKTGPTTAYDIITTANSFDELVEFVEYIDTTVYNSWVNHELEMEDDMMAVDPDVELETYLQPQPVITIDFNTKSIQLSTIERTTR